MKKFEVVKLMLFLGFAWFVLAHGRGFIENMRAKNSIKESLAASFVAPAARTREATRTEETKDKVSSLSMRSEPKIHKITENQISHRRSAYAGQRYEENEGDRVYPDLQK